MLTLRKGLGSNKSITSTEKSSKLDSVYSVQKYNLLFLHHTVLHAILLTICIYGWITIPHEISIYIDSNYGSRMKYLTFLCSFHAIVLIFINWISYIYSSLWISKFLEQSFAIQIQLSTLITLQYWGILYFHPDGFIPRHLLVKGIFMPLLTDLSLHLAPAVSVITLFIVTKRYYTFQIKSSYILSTILIGICYTVWQAWFKYMTGHHIYPFTQICSDLYSPYFSDIFNVVSAIIAIIVLYITEIISKSSRI